VAAVILFPTKKGKFFCPVFFGKDYDPTGFVVAASRSGDGFPASSKEITNV
jgi:hypothetical protein